MPDQALHPIKTLEDVHQYLYQAMRLEHATIPVYLTALYSIHPGTNIDAVQIIRVAAVEEMLHLTLAANLMNAVGGKVDLTKPGFIPPFPTPLPDGETDFRVDRAAFSEQTVDMFLQIERPKRPQQDECSGSSKQQRSSPEVIKRPTGTTTIVPTIKIGDDSLHFYSIGEFYLAIEKGLEQLCKELGEDQVFCDEQAKQITPEYYYSGGGEIIPVYDLSSAKEAIRLISEQGEGHEGEILDFEQEISHYYRFQQLKLGQYYVAGDTPGNPSGPKIDVDWAAVYPVKPNVKLEDLGSEHSELYSAANDFNKAYKDFLARLTTALSGKPDEFLPAIGDMFHIRNKAVELTRNPIPGTMYHAAPTFEVDPKPQEETCYG